MKAGRVKGLRRVSKLGGAARRIAAQRIADMLQFDEAVRDPANIRELHDLRIAAKRLRYTLEVLGGALGPAAAAVEDEARALQDVLGEVHDCDVLAPRLQQELARLVATTARPSPRSRTAIPTRRRGFCATPRAGPCGTACWPSRSGWPHAAACSTRAFSSAGTSCSRARC